MWCSSCRADVAAELSTDNRRMLCARCQSELGIAAAAMPRIATAPRTVETERDARELLARWTSQNLLDVAPPTAASSPPKQVNSTETVFARPELRFDHPRMTVPAPSAAFMAAVNENPVPSPAIPLNTPHQHESHEKQSGRRKRARHPRLAETTGPDRTTGPERNSTTPSQSDKPSVDHAPSQDYDQIGRDALHGQLSHRTSWSMLAGQLCAYGGVGLLTCGTVLVMWSYFGGPANYMPTGWLSAALGQMLLFLGVVTLISSGLEQTVSEVSWRIDHLAEEVHHMGLALDELEHEHRQARHQRSATKDRRGTDGPAREAA